MRKQITKYGESLLVVLTATLLWWSAEAIIKTPQSESWFWPLIFFSLFFIAWSLASVLIKNKGLFIVISLTSLATSLLWLQSWGYIAFITVALFSLYSGWRIAQRELSLRVKISIWNSLRLERRLFIFAISLLLAGQYFFMVGQTDANKTLPMIKISDKQAKYLTQIISKFDPGLKSQRNINEITVDEFILQNAGNVSKEYSNQYQSITPEQKKMLDENKRRLILQKGRENFSKMLERKVAGNEKVLDVFTEIVNHKINNFADNSIGYLDQSIPLTHLIFSGLLFLTIFSLGMLVSPLLIMLTWLLFESMVTVGLVAIEKKMAEVEVIA